MKINIVQIILIGICIFIAVYFTYSTINLIVTGGNVYMVDEVEVTLGFLDYGMIQFYIFMGVMAFLLFMLAGSGKKE
jgi:hypothetical protein